MKNPDSEKPVSGKKNRIFRFRLWKIGLPLLGWTVIMVWISTYFSYELPLSDKPIVLMTFISLGGGLIFTLLPATLRNLEDDKTVLWGILILGLIFRVIMIFSTPILEDDFYRYLWDGAAVAHGINPYQYPPEVITAEVQEESAIPSKLIELRGESGVIIHRINYPYVRTIYPIVAQVYFALAYFLKPWSLIAWKFVLLPMDILFYFILLFTLRTLQIPLRWIALYWWNPLLIKETFNSGHMDILIFPFLFIFLWLVNRQNFFSASGFLGLAVNVKFWPALLFPFMLRKIFRRPTKFILPAIFFILLLSITFLLTNPLHNLSTSAFYNYSTRWESNDGIFKILVWLNQLILKILAIHPGHAALQSRILIVLIAVGMTIYLSFNKSQQDGSIYRKSMILITLVFFISPTQFPWYYIWLIPFLCIQPRFSLILLTPLLSIYYLRYYFLSINKVQLYDNVLVWIQYIPVWFLLFREWYINNFLNSAKNA